MASKRFLIVPEDSSAARMPRPGATMASATLLSSARFIEASVDPAISPAILPSLDALGKGLLASPFISTAGTASSHFEHFHARERLALEPFEERAARGRDICEPLGHARGVERRHRIAAARNGTKPPGAREFRRRLGHLDRAGIERLELEGAERPVPDQGPHPREHGADVL